MNRATRTGVLVAALVLVAAACGGGAGGGGGGRVESEQISGNVTLSGWASSPTETNLLKQVLADFEKRFPRIKVKYEPISGDYAASMLAQFSARRPPDVFYVDSNVVPDWIQQGVLEPLDGYIEANDFSLDPFFDPLVEAFRGPDGSLYGLPKDWSPLATFTNDAFLGEAGVEPPQTWEELRSSAQALQGAIPGGKPICLSKTWDRMLAFVYQNGGRFLSEDGSEVVIDSPEAEEAVNFYVGLVRDGLAGTPDELGVGWCGEALGKERAAIVFEGNWLVPFMEETFPDVDYTISPIVQGEQQADLAFTVSYSMAADSKNKDAAWVLISYLTGPEGMKTWTSKGLALPSREDVEPVPGREAFIEAADYSEPWQFAPKFATVIDQANNAVDPVFEGKTSADAALQKIAESARQALQG